MQELLPITVAQLGATTWSFIRTILYYYSTNWCSTLTVPYLQLLRVGVNTALTTYGLKYCIVHHRFKSYVLHLGYCRSYKNGCRNKWSPRSFFCRYSAATTAVFFNDTANSREFVNLIQGQPLPTPQVTSSSSCKL